MKTIVQLGASALALLGLLCGPASHATNLAELPMKASVLAKPNVIFGMDDSGSMDWEVLLDTSSGMLWWNGTTAWNTAQNKPLSSYSTWSYAYLFPIGPSGGGSNQGGQLYAYDSNYRALPPTRQFAWLRSSAFNPLYYNTRTTYTPWAPAYLDSATQSYANASTTAARSHPAYSTPTLNLTSDWTSSNGDWTSNGFRFYVRAGMVLPSGSTLVTSSSGGGGTPCSGSTSRTTTAEQTVPSGNACWASMPYYPATFWNAETCSVNTTDCVAAPDGSTLKRYEVRSGNNSYPSSRTYAQEIQNFANWFTYHRKRKLMLAGSMGAVLENLTGMRLGLMSFTDESASTPTVTMYDTDNTNNSLNGRRVAGYFYRNALAAEGTPTHATVKHIAKQFSENSGIVQYACQRNSMFIVTDGFSNTASITSPSWDVGKSATTWGSGAPYQTTASGTLADLALRYYTNRLRTDLPLGKVPPSSSSAANADTNPDLHITNYAISLGVRGALWPTTTDPFVTAPTWTTPVADDPSLIDDMWHATINGRGKMYLATNPTDTAASIRAGLDDILSQEGAQGGIAVSSVNLAYGDAQAYLGSYNPRGWTGDLTANSINVDTGAITTSTDIWSASALLGAKAWNTRVIFTASGSSGVDFSIANVGATANPDSATFTDQVAVEYLRGNRSGEGDTVRLRSSLLGPVVNAEPVLARDEHMVYVAAGEGMLHAFDTVTGAEHWAFVPPDQIANIGKAVKRGWAYQTLLDATPTYARLGDGSKLLVGGLGAAGRSYYALNVSSPRDLNTAQAAAQFRWIFPTTGDSANRAKMGYTVGKASVVRTTADGDVVLVTSGYDNGQTLSDGKGRVWMLNATTGAVIKTFRTTAGAAGAEAGLAHVSAFKEPDGMVRYVYGGDLLGNLWRFDLTASGSGEIDGTLIATLKDASSNIQPITAAPELTTVSGKRVLLIGTGRLLDIGDFGSTRTQSFYAIADGTALANARAGLVARTYTRSTDTFAGAAFNWATDRGWYFDLPAGEQANTDPVIAYGAVAFTTNVNGSSDCSQQSYLYLVDIGTGLKVAASTTYPTPFGSIQLAGNSTSSRAIALRTRGGKIRALCHLSDNTSCGAELPLGGNIKPGKNAWKEIRR